MPLNANIISQYTPPLRSVMDYSDDMDRRDLLRAQVLGAARQNALAALTARQTEQTIADTAADRAALQGIASGWNAGTTLDQRIAALRNSGRPALMTQADALEKQGIDRTKGDAEAKAKQAEVLGKVLTAQGELATRVFANPTREAAAAAIANMKAITAALGVPMDFSGEEAAIGLFRTPEDVKRWAAGHALKAEQLLPKLQALNAGGQYVNQAVDPLTGRPTDTGVVPITQSADNAATNATSRANNAATIAGENFRQGRSLSQAERLAGQAVTYQQDANGNIVALPSKVAPGQLVRAAAVAAPGAGLTPLQGKDSGMNAEQSNALTFAARMQAAHKILNELQGKYSPSAVNTKTGLGDVYGVGGVLEAGANALLTPEGQRADQAQRDFINAILRRESGAAISAGEFSNAAKQYFPQANDKPAAIEQKRQARERAIQGLLQAVPKKERAKFDELAGPQQVAPGSVLKFDANGNLVQ